MAYMNYNRYKDDIADVSALSIASSSSSSYSDDSNRLLVTEQRPLAQDDISYPPSLESGRHLFRAISTDQYECKAIRVYDMRAVRHMSYGREYRLKCKSMSQPYVAAEVAAHFDVDITWVHVIERSGQSEGLRLLTQVVVVPPVEQTEESLYVLVDFYTDVLPQQTLCIRFTLSATLVQILPTLERELQYSKLCFCKDGLVLSRDRTIQNLGLSPFDQVQLVHSQTKMVKFRQQPRTGAEFIFTMPVDTTWSTRQVKDAGLEEFGDLIPEKCQNSVLHLVSGGVLLQDDQCVGLWLGRTRDECLDVHFSNKDAIAVILKFKDGRKKVTKQMIVPLDCSSNTLRNLIGRNLNLDPKAVRLVIDDVRVDELDSLHNTLRNGCTISVGIKKRKKLRIKNSQTEIEMMVEMYLLESVYKLKKIVAETMGIDPLNFRLYCRGIEMKEKYFLLNYALKNNMQLTVTVYEKRLLVHVMIVFKHVRQNLIIDHPNKTTVGDLLLYCGHRHDYHSGSSRAIYGGRCLNPGMTLEQEDIESRTTIVIVHFEKSEHLREGLIPLFEVGADGQVYHEHAAVVSGILCKVSGPPQHVQAGSEADPRISRNNNGQLPPGIHLFKDQFGGSRPAVKPDRYRPVTQRRKDTKLSMIERQRLRDKFLPRAREVCQRRRMDICRGEMNDDDAEDITRVKEVYRRRNTGMKLGHKSSHPSFYLSSGADDELDTDGKLRTTAGPCTPSVENPGLLLNVNSEEEAYIVPDRSSRGRYSCEAEDRSNFKDESPHKVYGSKVIEDDVCSIAETTSVNLSPNENPAVREPEVLQASAASLRASQQASLVNQHEETWKKNIQPSRASNSASQSELAIARLNDSAANLAGSDSGVALDDLRAIEPINLPFSYRPFVHLCPYLSRLHQRALPRRRTRTTGDIESGDSLIPVELHHVSTFPQLTNKMSNDLLNSAGISIAMLGFISTHATRQWRILARELGVPENVIDSCAHNHRDNIQEAAYQALVAWKRQTGRQGSRDKLLQALEKVGLRNIAEKLDGYHTA